MSQDHVYNFYRPGLKDQPDRTCDYVPEIDGKELDFGDTLGKGAVGQVIELCEDHGDYLGDCEYIMKTQPIKTGRRINQDAQQEFQVNTYLDEKGFDRMPSIEFTYDCTKDSGKKVSVMIFEKYDKTITELLSPLNPDLNLDTFADMLQQIIDTLTDLHSYEVYHIDGHTENYMYKYSTNKYVLVDFGRSVFKSELRDSSNYTYYEKFDFTSIYLEVITTLTENFTDEGYSVHDEELDQYIRMIMDTFRPYILFMTDRRYISKSRQSDLRLLSQEFDWRIQRYRDTKPKRSVYEVLSVV